MSCSVCAEEEFVVEEDNVEPVAEAEVDRMPLALRSITKSRHFERSNNLFEMKNP